MNYENVIEKNMCTGCMACYNICPFNAIEVRKNNEGFDYPVINKDKCRNCGLCKKACPVINKIDKEHNVKVYACKNININERMKSSSGGIFTLIAKYILSQDGVVFGARLNNNLEVIHDYITNANDLNLLRGSKYVQSKIGNSYKNIKHFLEEGRKVLFSGTPCQVEGLLGYLENKIYDNLYIQDIICHGVPSPKVWDKYLKYKEEKLGQKIINVNFRRKDLTGWHNYQVSYTYSNTEENINHDDDPFMKLFLRNICLRNSCFNCQFKKINRNSDITLADFWGIENIDKELVDEKGISAVLINSKKGEELFNHIKKEIQYWQQNIENIIKYNSCINKSTTYNEKRSEFFEDLEKENFEVLINKYL